MLKRAFVLAITLAFAVGGVLATMQPADAIGVNYSKSKKKKGR